MKKNFIVAIILIAIPFLTFSQVKIKLGHIDSMELLSKMPGKDTAQKQLQEYASLLEAQLTAMQKEFETKYKEFQEKGATLPKAVLENKQKDLQDLQNRIEAFQESAQKDLKAKESELLKPLIDKAKKAIEQVAKDNGYTYIFDSSIGVLLYSEPSDDIMPLVKKRLGIK